MLTFLVWVWKWNRGSMYILIIFKYRHVFSHKIQKVSARAIHYWCGWQVGSLSWKTTNILITSTSVTFSLPWKKAVSSVYPLKLNSSVLERRRNTLNLRVLQFKTRVLLLIVRESPLVLREISFLTRILLLIVVEFPLVLRVLPLASRVFLLSGTISFCNESTSINSDSISSHRESIPTHIKKYLQYQREYSSPLLVFHIESISDSISRKNLMPDMWINLIFPG